MKRRLIAFIVSALAGSCVYHPAEQARLPLKRTLTAAAPTAPKSARPKTVTPGPFHLLDAYARITPPGYERDITTLARYLASPLKTEIEKARVIYTWVATHIRYDDEAYNAQRHPDNAAATVLRTRKAVCEGYSNLTKALCEAAGLRAEKVRGYAKGYGYEAGRRFTRANHSWIAVKMEGTWRLLDPTWGSGAGQANNGRLRTLHRFDPFWFDVHPKAFIFTHLPESAQWQFLEDSLTLEAFERLPVVKPDYFRVGFDPEQTFRYATGDNPGEFVEAYYNGFPLQPVALPFTRYLPRAKELSLDIRSDYAETFVLFDDQHHRFFTKEKNRFTITHKPKGSMLDICVKINADDTVYTTVARYRIVSGGKDL